MSLVKRKISSSTGTATTKRTRPVATDEPSSSSTTPSKAKSASTAATKPASPRGRGALFNDLLNHLKVFEMQDRRISLGIGRSRVPRSLLIEPELSPGAEFFGHLVLGPGGNVCDLGKRLSATWKTPVVLWAGMAFLRPRMERQSSACADTFSYLAGSVRNK